MDVILDTCGILSLSGVAKKLLTKSTKDIIRDATSVYVSACSLFEISIKVKKQKLDIGKDSPIVYWNRLIKHYSIDSIPVRDAVFYDSIQLADIHEDPFDRIIIAEALGADIPIVTYDPVFAHYNVKCIS